MRKPRLHVPGALYHVTLRGNHRQDIFFRPDDRTLLNSIVSEVIARYGARLHAYCWMTNHTHLLIQVSDLPLGRIMLRIASRYARELQARFLTTGHLFERRYHAVLVDANEYLLELVRYIHLNPVRAKMAALPAEYPWSSHQVYLGQRAEPWVTTEFALSLFHSDTHQAVTAYDRFVHADLAPASPLNARNPNDRRALHRIGIPSVTTCLLPCLSAFYGPSTVADVERMCIFRACQSQKRTPICWAIAHLPPAEGVVVSLRSSTLRASARLFACCN